MFYKAYHLEGVQLLLDLLRKHGGQSVAGSNLTATIVLLTRPSIVEDDTGRESSVTLGRSVGSVWCALAVLS
jgi:hypothetical protein